MTSCSELQPSAASFVQDEFIAASGLLITFLFFGRFAGQQVRQLPYVVGKHR